MKFKDLLNENDNEAIQLYIDIISSDPNSDKGKKFKQELKLKYNIDYDKIDRDQQYIDTANLKDIKTKNDFLNYNKYIQYAKEILYIRGINKNQIKPNNKIINVPLIEKQLKELGLKTKYKEYSGGNLASHSISNVLTIPENIDIHTLIHEIGHHFDNSFSMGYKGISNTATHSSSFYYMSNAGEVLAENFANFFLIPSWMKKYLPEVYIELNSKIPSKYKTIINNIIKSL